jgi:2-(3-amino-3-carboxypropyl)histidine synthase
MEKTTSKKTSIIFIPAKYNKDITISAEVIDKVPSKVMLFSSVQFLHQLPSIIKQLESAGKNVLMVRSKNFLYEGMISEKGQLLGCNAETFDIKSRRNEFDAFLYIGDGIFHPQALLVNNRKDIYCYNPKTKRLNILKKELYDNIQKRRKGSILRLLSSKNIGIIILEEQNF